MSPIIAVSLLLLNLPVFLIIKQQLFPDKERWQQAISLSHPPEMTQILLTGDWRELLKHLNLAVFASLCASTFLAQYFILILALNWL